MPQLKVAMVANDLKPTPEWVGRQLTEQGIELLERDCSVASEVVETAALADVVWTMGGSRVITPDVLPLLRKCRAILRTGTGTDNIPVEEATRLGIVVANTPEVTMHQVAEHAIGLLFAVIRQIARQDRLVRQGVWDRYQAWPDWHLVGQTFGLVGFGRIARLVARKISGLELNLIACDPALGAGVLAAQGIEKVTLDELFSRSDFISVHVPLSEKTRHSIGEHQLRLMKPKAVLINTARGEIIDQQALVRALSERSIAGAGLDVLDPEPPAPDDPILGLDNVVITPHIAGYSDLFREGFWKHSVETLLAISRTGLPIWIVNPEVTPWWNASSGPA
jgi:D-3-phosphoglycerate dehydrogenase / 2-oxoglutarate reductase